MVTSQGVILIMAKDIRDLRVGADGRVHRQQVMFFDDRVATRGDRFILSFSSDRNDEHILGEDAFLVASWSVFPAIGAFSVTVISNTSASSPMRM